MKSGKWSVQTRWLHIGLAVTVTLQLAISLIMAPPDKETATAFARTAFEAHEVVGMSALAIVLMHWFWSVVGRAEGGLAHLFPWTGAAWARVKGDIGLLIRGRLPDDGPRGGLPGFVHGLGLLAVAGMGIHGAVLVFMFNANGKPSNTVESIIEVHEFIANFVWFYWFGHIAVALFLKWAGLYTVKAMFSLNP